MMHNDGVGVLLRLQMELLGEPHPYVFLGLEQPKYLRLIFQIWARRIAKRIA